MQQTFKQHYEDEYISVRGLEDKAEDGKNRFHNDQRRKHSVILVGAC